MMKQPLIESKIKDGEINLSKAAKLSNLIEKAKTEVKKKDLLIICDQIKNKSVRHTEDVVRRHLQIERAKFKNIILNESQVQKLDKVRKLYGDISDNELIEILLSEKLHNSAPKNKIKTVARVSRYIPKKVRHAAFTKAQHQCQFVSRSGRRCCEKRFLELDHVKPFSRNGLNNLQNIQVLCSNHNKFKGSEFLNTEH